MTIKQVSVFMENKSGQIAEITDVLGKNNVDLRAINLAETAEYGVLRLIAADSGEAARILTEQGFIVSMTPVTAVAVPDEPGGLAKLLAILAKAGIDIEYMYSVFGRADGVAYMIFRVADVVLFQDVLAKNNLETVSGEELGVR